jgi:hypothetical protein
VGNLIDRSFNVPAFTHALADNVLTPGTTPFEPSFSEREPDALRFTLQPLGPTSSALSRRDEATREMRRLSASEFGRGALGWFDQRSEEWRGQPSTSRLSFGAWIGTAYDRDGLAATKVYYELTPTQLDVLPPRVAGFVRIALETMPTLHPLFTSIVCRRHQGGQRVTFLVRGGLRINDLEPLMRRFGMAQRLPSILQIAGLTLGGRFEVPEESVLLGIGATDEGPELKVEIMLGRIPDLPPQFVDLLALGLSERPHELRALARWLRAFTPERYAFTGDFSVLSIRATPATPARVSLYLRPIEFDVADVGPDAGAPTEDQSVSSRNLVSV